MGVCRKLNAASSHSITCNIRVACHGLVREVLDFPLKLVSSGCFSMHTAVSVFVDEVVAPTHRARKI